ARPCSRSCCCATWTPSGPRRGRRGGTRPTCSDRRRAGPAGAALELGELGGELVEPDDAEAERGTVERLQVEGVAEPALHRFASLQPHALADLVADRLTGEAEVAVDL